MTGRGQAPRCPKFKLCAQRSASAPVAAPKFRKKRSTILRSSRTHWLATDWTSGARGDVCGKCASRALRRAAKYCQRPPPAAIDDGNCCFTDGSVTAVRRVLSDALTHGGAWRREQCELVVPTLCCLWARLLERPLSGSWYGFLPRIAASLRLSMAPASRLEFRPKPDFVRALISPRRKPQSGTLPAMRRNVHLSQRPRYVR